LNSGGNNYNAFPENQLIKKYFGDGTTSSGGGATTLGSGMPETGCGTPFRLNLTTENKIPREVGRFVFNLNELFLY